MEDDFPYFAGKRRISLGTGEGTGAERSKKPTAKPEGSPSVIRTAERKRAPNRTERTIDCPEPGRRIRPKTGTAGGVLTLLSDISDIANGCSYGLRTILRLQRLASAIG